MAELSAVLRSIAGGRVGFWCPGCDEAHTVTVEGPSAWGWDGNADCPTFSPSIKVTGYKMSAEGEAMLARGESPPNGRYPGADTCCHSFVKAGMIQFLGDCTHSLANQTVPLIPWPGRTEGEGTQDG